jgi:hypothetical protein
MVLVAKGDWQSRMVTQLVTKGDWQSRMAIQLLWCAKGVAESDQ